MGSSERSGSWETSSSEGSDLGVGHVVADRYRIVGKLGTGGIGIVYRAAQLPLERPVAVKVLHDDLLSLEELRARFEREARVLSALTHPHVVSISDYGIDGDRPFLVMELLEGRTLEEVVRGDPMEPERALSIGRQILLGLAFAHAKGIAHRDLKPANVFLSRMPDGTEHAKLLDFGLARMVQNDGDIDDQPTLTTRGVVFGTPAYMSPEQASGSPADERSDVYSAAVLLFELLAGRRPFVGDTRAELLRAHLAAPVPRLSSIRPELRLDPALAKVIDVAMAKEPNDRFPDARDMLAAFDAIDPPLAWTIPFDQISEAPTQRIVYGSEDISEAPTQYAGEPVEPLGEKRSARPFVLLGLLAVALVLLVVLWPAISERLSLGIIRVEPGDASPAGVAARDPWAEPPPEPLTPFLRMVEEGHVFEDQSELRQLFLLAREMEDDARPRLLLGHLFIAKGWVGPGIRRYELALQLDPSVRGDPRLLANVVDAAARETTHERAVQLIERNYGHEALPAVEAKIVELEGDAVPQLRLVRLRDRL